MKTTEEVAQIVESEGLGYTIQFYMDDDIADPNLQGFWRIARIALDNIKDILDESRSSSNT